jgi:hypothetical protein
MVDGEGGAELARRFADVMLEELVHKEGMLRLGAKELHSFDSVAAFAALLRHTRKASGLEIGDLKAELNAEWLPVLCTAMTGHPTLRQLTLRRMLINAVPAAAADAGLQALSNVLRASSALEVLQLQSCGLESRHVLPLCSELRSSPIRLKQVRDRGLHTLSASFNL